jgi:hypothetical protein
MKIKFLLGCVILYSASTFGQKANRAFPDFAVVQLAGSIGTVSAGFGYNVFKSRARVSTHFGISPEKGVGTLNVISTKFFYKPVTLTIWNRLRMNPVDFGFIGSYSFGARHNGGLPETNLPADYYWWNPAFRAHLGMESSITFEFPKECSLHSATSYVEINTNEFYFISFLQNSHALRVQNIVKLGMGTRLTF